MSFLQFGQAGETAVVNLLQKEDFAILEQNYKKFFGEIDIIAQKDDIIVFVEVKTRKNPKTSMFGLITPSKQHKISLVAREYIARKNLTNITYRFDVALVQCNDKESKKITYIPNAFYQKERL